MQLSARTVWITVTFGGLLTAVVACSSATSSFDGSAGDGVGFAGPTPLPPPTAPTGNRDFFEPACPADAPSEGQSCTPDDATCEYGASDDPACDVVARCDPKTGWSVDQATHCPTTCPAHFDEQAPGTSCQGTDVCTYLEATCGCAGAIDGAWTTISGGSNNVGGGGDGGDGGDASSTDGGAGPSAIGQWQCVRPVNGCPARRPLEGTRCTTAMDCDYGTCVFGVPLSLTCLNGRWTAVLVGSCP